MEGPGFGGTGFGGAGVGVGACIGFFAAARAEGVVIRISAEKASVVVKVSPVPARVINVSISVLSFISASKPALHPIPQTPHGGGLMSFHFTPSHRSLSTKPILLSSLQRFFRDAEWTVNPPPTTAVAAIRAIVRWESFMEGDY